MLQQNQHRLRTSSEDSSVDSPSSKYESQQDSKKVVTLQDLQKESFHREYQRARKQSKQPKVKPLPQYTPTMDMAALPGESNYVALDCEMVGVGPGGYESSLARVTLVDWCGRILLDRYVQQTRPVTDYRTFVSGITPEILERGSAMTLEHVRGIVMQYLNGRILVGHGLENDLKALRIQHPWWLIRDTAAYQPFMQVRGTKKKNIYLPRKLKHLAKELLRQDIQVYGKPHDPKEDAYAALSLYCTVRLQWENAVYYCVQQEQQNQYFEEQQRKQYYLHQPMRQYMPSGGAHYHAPRQPQYYGQYAQYQQYPAVQVQ